jgi:hypothetical protein
MAPVTPHENSIYWRRVWTSPVAVPVPQWNLAWFGKNGEFFTLHGVSSFPARPVPALQSILIGEPLRKRPFYRPRKRLRKHSEAYRSEIECEDERLRSWLEIVQIPVLTVLKVRFLLPQLHPYCHMHKDGVVLMSWTLRLEFHIVVFCVMKSCTLVGDANFSETYCLHLRIKSEAICASETLVPTSQITLLYVSPPRKSRLLNMESVSVRM